MPSKVAPHPSEGGAAKKQAGFAAKKPLLIGLAAILALGLIAALDPVAAASGHHPLLKGHDRRLMTKICSVCAVGMFWNGSQDFLVKTMGVTQMIGEAALVEDGYVRTATVQAVGDEVQCLTMTRSTFRSL